MDKRIEEKKRQLIEAVEKMEMTAEDAFHEMEEFRDKLEMEEMEKTLRKSY